MDFYFVNGQGVPCVACATDPDMVEDYSNYGLVEYDSLQDALADVAPVDIPEQAMLPMVVFVSSRCYVKNAIVTEHNEWDILRLMQNFQK